MPASESGLGPLLPLFVELDELVPHPAQDERRRAARGRSREEPARRAPGPSSRGARGTPRRARAAPRARGPARAALPRRAATRAPRGRDGRRRRARTRRAPGRGLGRARARARSACAQPARSPRRSRMRARSTCSHAASFGSEAAASIIRERCAARRGASSAPPRAKASSSPPRAAGSRGAQRERALPLAHDRLARRVRRPEQARSLAVEIGPRGLAGGSLELRVEVREDGERLLARVAGAPRDPVRRGQLRVSLERGRACSAARAASPASSAASASSRRARAAVSASSALAGARAARSVPRPIDARRLARPAVELQERHLLRVVVPREEAVVPGRGPRRRSRWPAPTACAGGRAGRASRAATPRSPRRRDSPTNASSASARAPAVCHRSSGSRASARITVRRELGRVSLDGHGCRIGAGVVARAARVARSLSPLNRRRPVVSSHSVTPSANTSVRRSTALPWACSGDMYASLPFTMPCVVDVMRSAARATPKSMIFGRPSYVTMTLVGLMSRWTMLVARRARARSAGRPRRRAQIHAATVGRDRDAALARRCRRWRASVCPSTSSIARK